MDAIERLRGFDFNPCSDLWKPNIDMAVFMILIVIVGLFGNAIVFFVIIVLKEYKKSVSNWYVLQLALADTLFLLMLPFTASSEMAGKWEFSTTLCKAKEGILFVNYYASIFFLTIMSFDRYVAVTQSGVSPWADRLRKIKSAVIISVATWIISIILCTPIFLYSRVNKCSTCAYEFPLTDFEKCQQAAINSTYCPTWLKLEELAIDEPFGFDMDFAYNDSSDFLDVDNFTNIIEMIRWNNSAIPDICMDHTNHVYRVWLYLNFSTMLVLPFVLICAFYGMILWTMMGTASTASTSQRQYRRRVTLMVLALVSLFAISWVPWYAVKLALVPGISFSSTACTKLQNFSRIMSYLNSALNPYFYSFMGSRFHQRFLKARSTATRKSRLLSVLSRLSFHSPESNNSTSGGNGRENPVSNERKLKQMVSDDESSNAKSQQRTERTMVDQP